MTRKGQVNRRIGKAVPVLFFLIASCAAANAAQRVAVILPEPSAHASKVAELFAEAFRVKFTVLDLSMTEAAFGANRPATPFNMTTAEAKAAAEVIGCETFLLLRAGTLRRTSLERPEYYESFVTIYTVDGRSGRLTAWDLASFEEASSDIAEKRVLNSAPALARSNAERLANAQSSMPSELRRPRMEEAVPESAAPDLKPPIPYNRIKPEYTKTAYLYGIRATVDIEADVDETGTILRTAVVRWAGYGLDDAVIKAVRSMNWRPAMRGGKPLPMRVLLRYNFTKIEKE